jgi:hypothetical protein
VIDLAREFRRRRGAAPDREGRDRPVGHLTGAAQQHYQRRRERDGELRAGEREHVAQRGVDYYQLVRKWQVDVYQYGMRLTYDVVIPEPGSDLLGKMRQLAEASNSLDGEFVFDVDVAAITREMYVEKAAAQGASVPPPPPLYKYYDEVATHKWKTKDEAERSEFFELEVEVDDDYEIDLVSRDHNYTVYEGEKWHFGWQSVDDFIGKTGKRAMVYQAYYLGSLYVELRVRARLRDEAYQAWQLKAWSAIRDAAQARYYENLQKTKDRIARLTADLGAQDALSLRKVERDEIMKGVIRWLFGSGFKFAPGGLPDELYAPDQSVASEQEWSDVMSQSALIGFLHQAVEWENVLYLLYPYFWSHMRADRDLKRDLDHPDPLHRAFLKAGAARVVLTIRPGFERDFAALMDGASFGKLAPSHPYMGIIDEMEAYAHTNFPDLPAANPDGTSPDGLEAAEKGQLVGTWFEYTPTSGLDVAFGETMPGA